MEMFKRVALAQPARTFRLTADEKLLFHLPAASLPQRIIQVFGDKVSQQWIKVEAQASSIRFKGYLWRQGPTWHQFVVNGRPVRDNHLHQVIARLTKSGTGKVPSYVLFIDLPPEWVDVNVHPAKELVQFADIEMVSAYLESALKKALAQSMFGMALSFDAPPVITKAVQQVRPTPQVVASRVNQLTEAEPTTSAETAAPQLFGSESSQQARVLVVQDEYALTHLHSGILIVHLKNAYRRIAYEQLLQTLEESRAPRQHVLFPKLVTLTGQAPHLVEQWQAQMRRLGFDLERTGLNTFIVRAVPTFVEKADIQVLMDALWQHYQQHPDIQTLIRVLTEYATLPPVTTDSVEQLVHQLFMCREPYRTPEGRPTVYKVAFQDLEKYFKSQR